MDEQHRREVEQLEREAGRPGARPDEIQRLRNEVVEEILTLRCPGCGRAFYDFDGCLSVACSMDAGGAALGCGEHFCALCLQSCGKGGEGSVNAHRHVPACQFNPTRENFGSAQLVKEAHRERRTRLLRAFLARQRAEVRPPLLAALERDLEYLGMSWQDFAEEDRREVSH